MRETSEHYRPYLAMAVFCEKVLQEKDGVLSLIRVVDQINCAGRSEQMPPTPIQLVAVLAFKAGFLRGKYMIKLRPKPPSREAMSTNEFPAFFEGEDRGVNIIVNYGFVTQEEGIYWFDVLVEEELITSISLRILYQRVGPVGTGTS
jgi:hypothetical protein